MYLDFLVKVPTVKGKITRRKKSNVVYIEYEYDRVCKFCSNGTPILKSAVHSF